MRCCGEIARGVPNEVQAVTSKVACRQASSGALLMTALWDSGSLHYYNVPGSQLRRIPQAPNRILNVVEVMSRASVPVRALASELSTQYPNPSPLSRRRMILEGSCWTGLQLAACVLVCVLLKRCWGVQRLKKQDAEMLLADCTPCIGSLRPSNKSKINGNPPLLGSRSGPTPCMCCAADIQG